MRNVHEISKAKVFKLYRENKERWSWDCVLHINPAL